MIFVPNLNCFKISICKKIHFSDAQTIYSFAVFRIFCHFLSISLRGICIHYSIRKLIGQSASKSSSRLSPNTILPTFFFPFSAINLGKLNSIVVQVKTWSAENENLFIILFKFSSNFATVYG